MKMVSRREVLALMGSAPLAGGPLAGAARAAGPEDSDPPRKFRTDISARERMRERFFPNVLLTTHEGRKVRFYDDLIKDKLVVLNFMYAKCTGVCPGITSNLVRVQQLLGERAGREVFMYSFTLRPQEDTPQKLAEYVKMHRIGPGWLFLTGDPADMELLRRKLGFTNPDPKLDADVEQHIGNVRYGNEPLQRWGACPGLSKADFIVESINWVDWQKADREALKGEPK
jgi:protein SCO1